jgi:hypothetical protein
MRAFATIVAKGVRMRAWKFFFLPVRHCKYLLMYTAALEQQMLIYRLGRTEHAATPSQRLLAQRCFVRTQSSCNSEQQASCTYFARRVSSRSKCSYASNGVSA